MRKILPPALFVISLLLMGLLHYCWPIMQVVAFPYRCIGLPILVTGIGISAWHSRLFHKLDTNIYTFEAPGKLVTAGMFRVSRNPMYLGFVVALLGHTLLLGSLSPLIVLLAFIAITDRWYIAFEEKAMLKKFGEQYLDYKKRVRRWL